MEKDKSILAELKKADAEMLAAKFQTSMNKLKFIRELEDGLAAKILENPNTITKIKVSRWEKFKNLIFKL